MKISKQLSLLLSLMLIFITAPLSAENNLSKSSSSKAPLSKIQWQQDIDKLYASICCLHPNPWRTLSAKKFKQSLQKIADASDKSSKALTISKLIQAVAKVSKSGEDGITGISPFQQSTAFHLLPIQLYSFSDGMYVVSANQEHGDLVGKQLVSIAGVPIKDVVAKLQPYLSNESEMWSKNISPSFVIVSELLETLDLSSNLITSIKFTSSQGKTENRELKAITLSNYSEHVTKIEQMNTLPPVGTSDFQRQQIYSERYWYRKLDNSTLYMQYNDVQAENFNGQSFADFMHELEMELKKFQLQSLIVDLRFNSGSGDIFANHRSYAAFFDLINNFESEARPLTLYVLTGRATFAVASDFATDIDKRTKAIFIGEKMGGALSHFAEPEQVLLINSKLKVKIATRYWNKTLSSATSKSLSPNFPIALSAKEYYSQIDPALIKALQLIELSQYD